MDDLLLKKDESSDSNIKLNLSKNPNFSISKSERYYVFFLLIISNVFIQMDHGSIPASTWNLYQIFNSNQEIGLFGSLVFIGNLLGSLIYFYLINAYHRKKLLIYSMFFIAICLITFILTTNTIYLLINRVILGLFQAYFIIYLPLWCNQYGITKQREIMFSFAQLTTPLGVFVGYIIASECISINENIGWKFSFIIQSIIILLMIYLFYRVSDKLFDSKYVSYKEDKEDIDINTTNIADITFFKLSESIVLEQDKNLSDIINISYLSQIFSNKIYLLSIFSITCIYYSVTGVQYWGGDYMNRILKVHSPQKRLLYFSIICFTSPTIGVIIAGYIVKKINNGYNNIKVFNICLYCSILTFICGVISAFVTEISWFILFLWISFFFGGIIVPNLTGIIINSLPQHLRASGYSLLLFFGTLLGYLPAPFVYGVLEDYFKDGGKRSYIFNMAFLLICVVLLYNNKKVKEKNDNIINGDNNNNNNSNNNLDENTNVGINGQNYEEVPTQ